MASKLLLVCSLAVLSLTAVLADGVWNQIHHDARNTGRAPWTASVVNGQCKNWDVAANVSDPSGPEVIQADGVLSLDGSAFYYVGQSPSHHAVHKIDAVTGEPLGVWINQFASIGVTSVGGAALGLNLATNSEIFYAAFDEVVHSIDPTSMTGFWSWAGPNPVLAPIRLSPHGEVVLVATSNATHDSNGVLHALNSATGQEVWNFTCMEGPKSWGLRITPAVTSTGVVFLAFGQSLVALDIRTGAELSRDNTLPFLALMGSSPVVPADGMSVFVRSKSDGGDVWKFSVNSTTPPLQVNREWACGYQQLQQQCLNFTAPNQPIGPQDLDEKWARQYSETPAEAGLQLQPGDDNVGTLALGPNDESLIFGLYAQQANLGGVHSASSDHGGRNWRYLSSEDSSQLGDMMSRSSPAVDAAGNVFIGMDQVNPQQNGVPPVLLALDAGGNRMWVDSGDLQGPFFNPIGLRSPLLGYAPSEGVQNAKVIFARKDSVAAFGPGQLCPSSTPLYGCSGHGACDCNTGFCDCYLNMCFTGDDCGVPQDCNGHGSCQQGICQCNADSACWSGPYCGDENLCSGRGSCSESQHGCTCTSNCYFGDTCQYEQDCNANGKCDFDSGQCACYAGFTGFECLDYSPPSSGGLGGGWVFLIVLSIFLLLGAIGAYVHRRKSGTWFWERCRKKKAEAQPLTRGSAQL